jgi:mannose/fructose/N-acetylgalactosamine-specific phosphotransferase system component IIB
MSIVLARIDSRLIHGQVLEAWAPHCKATCIVVANNAIVPVQKIIMQAAVPRKIKVQIGTVAEVADMFSAGELDNERVLLLFATSRDALDAYRLGVPMTRVNLGNMHAEPGKSRYSRTIALDEADVDNLHHLVEAGVRVVVQCVPSEWETSFKKLLKAKTHEC